MARPNSAFEAGNKYQPAVGAFEYIGLGALDDLLHGLVEVATWELSERLGLGGYEDHRPSESDTFEVLTGQGSEWSREVNAATTRHRVRCLTPRERRPGLGERTIAASTVLI